MQAGSRKRTAKHPQKRNHPELIFGLVRRRHSALVAVELVVSLGFHGWMCCSASLSSRRMRRLLLRTPGLVAEDPPFHSRLACGRGLIFFWHSPIRSAAAGCACSAPEGRGRLRGRTRRLCLRGRHFRSWWPSWPPMTNSFSQLLCTPAVHFQPTTMTSMSSHRFCLHTLRQITTQPSQP